MPPVPRCIEAAGLDDVGVERVAALGREGEELPDGALYLSLIHIFCQSACPNETIRITTEMVTDPETGKSKRRLVLYQYDLGSVSYTHLERHRPRYGFRRPARRLGMPGL